MVNVHNKTEGSADGKKNRQDGKHSDELSDNKQHIARMFVLSSLYLTDSTPDNEYIHQAI